MSYIDFPATTLTEMDLLPGDLVPVNLRPGPDTDRLMAIGQHLAVVQNDGTFENIAAIQSVNTIDIRTLTGPVTVGVGDFAIATISVMDGDGNTSMQDVIFANISPAAIIVPTANDTTGLTQVGGAVDGGGGGVSDVAEINALTGNLGSATLTLNALRLAGIVPDANLPSDLIRTIPDNALNTNTTVEDVFGITDGTFAANDLLARNSDDNGWTNIAAERGLSVDSNGIGLTDTGVTAQAYSNPTSITVDAQGRVSSVTAGTANTGLTQGAADSRYVSYLDPDGTGNPSALTEVQKEQARSNIGATSIRFGEHTHFNIRVVHDTTFNRTELFFDTAREAGEFFIELTGVTMANGQPIDGTANVSATDVIAGTRLHQVPVSGSALFGQYTFPTDVANLGSVSLQSNNNSIYIIGVNNALTQTTGHPIQVFRVVGGQLVLRNNLTITEATGDEDDGALILDVDVPDVTLRSLVNDDGAVVLDDITGYTVTPPEDTAQSVVHQSEFRWSFHISDDSLMNYPAIGEQVWHSNVAMPTLGTDNVIRGRVERREDIGTNLNFIELYIGHQEDRDHLNGLDADGLAAIFDYGFTNTELREHVVTYTNGVGGLRLASDLGSSINHNADTGAPITRIDGGSYNATTDTLTIPTAGGIEGVEFPTDSFTSVSVNSSGLFTFANETVRNAVRDSLGAGSGVNAEIPIADGLILEYGTGTPFTVMDADMIIVSDTNPTIQFRRAGADATTTDESNVTLQIVRTVHRVELDLDDFDQTPVNGTMGISLDSSVDKTTVWSNVAAYTRGSKVRVIDNELERDFVARRNITVPIDLSPDVANITYSTTSGWDLHTTTQNAIPGVTYRFTLMTASDRYVFEVQGSEDVGGFQWEPTDVVYLENTTAPTTNLAGVFVAPTMTDPATVVVVEGIDPRVTGDNNPSPTVDHFNWTETTLNEDQVADIAISATREFFNDFREEDLANLHVTYRHDTVPGSYTFQTQAANTLNRYNGGSTIATAYRDANFDARRRQLSFTIDRGSQPAVTVGQRIYFPRYAGSTPPRSDYGRFPYVTLTSVQNPGGTVQILNGRMTETSTSQFRNEYIRQQISTSEVDITDNGSQIVITFVAGPTEAIRVAGLLESSAATSGTGRVLTSATSGGLLFFSTARGIIQIPNNVQLTVPTTSFPSSDIIINTSGLGNTPRATHDGLTIAFQAADLIDEGAEDFYFNWVDTTSGANVTRPVMLNINDEDVLELAADNQNGTTTNFPIPQITNHYTATDGQVLQLDVTAGVRTAEWVNAGGVPTTVYNSEAELNAIPNLAAGTVALYNGPHFGYDFGPAFVNSNIPQMYVGDVVRSHTATTGTNLSGRGEFTLSSAANAVSGTRVDLGPASAVMASGSVLRLMPPTATPTDIEVYGFSATNSLEGFVIARQMGTTGIVSSTAALNVEVLIAREVVRRGVVYYTGTEWRNG